MQIEFIEQTHTYLVDGVIVPSVTQIMKQMSEAYYSGINEDVMKEAAARGTRVHKAIYDYEQLNAVIVDDAMPYFKNYLVAKQLKNFEPLMQEFALTEGTFAGTVDMLAEMGGQQVIIDLKVTSKFNKELAEVQLAGYVELCEKNGIGISATYILHIKKDTFKLHKVTPNFGKWIELKNKYYESLR